jgi:hypothetical protein
MPLRNSISARVAGIKGFRGVDAVVDTAVGVSLDLSALIY